MMIRFEPANNAGAPERQTELLSFDAAVDRWPWLISYRDTLAHGAAVFWNEGAFSLDSHSTPEIVNP